MPNNLPKYLNNMNMNKSSQTSFDDKKLHTFISERKKHWCTKSYLSVLIYRV